MRPSPNDRPSETEQLRARLVRLEVRFDEHTRETERVRAGAAGMTSGVVALLVSLVLPWLDTRSSITGWELITDEHFLLVLLVMVVLVVAAVRWVFRPSRGLHWAVLLLSVMPPLLTLFGLSLVSRIDFPETEPGFALMVAGCAVTAVTAGCFVRATHRG